MIKDDLPHVRIFTDGSCIENPGPGGWAAILSMGHTEKVLQGSEERTTNNRMELIAAIQALKALKVPCMVEIYTDSQYLHRGITEWLPGWRKKNWKRQGGVLANVDLWQALDAAQTTHEIRWHWVPGHAGYPENERVDRLARQAIHTTGTE